MNWHFCWKPYFLFLFNKDDHDKDNHNKYKHESYGPDKYDFDKDNHDKDNHDKDNYNTDFLNFFYRCYYPHTSWGWVVSCFTSELVDNTCVCRRAPATPCLSIN